ncbi:hypothetical protein GE061_007714 [Apolygus lucorum]|uniref:Trafficking protein particle complex subunit 11 n=1 Tax=Apolygus lucorum TaxID=248454 RepID=A0A8S9WP40_APOLU|nr:hypothetical protein GE061_007714 [Apolygus lucorum]
MTSLDRDFEFPAELLVQPQALVGISGLDTLNNAVHRAVWDALSASRRQQDRPPVQFKLLAASHEFPRPKSKKSYDQHIPKGILKRGWMHKHLTQVPSVVVVFCDLDWDDPQWEERKIECVSRVQSLREALKGRGSRVCLVLIQRKTPNPAIDDTLGTERAKEIFQAADLSNKSLYILPHNEHLLGFTAKLESAFYDLAKSYYQHEIRQIKQHREHLNKKNHQYLYVRHHFKIGFFCELRQDLVTAHCHYEEAYNSLLEARLLDTNEFEVKTVAGYISYKVSRVHFAMNRPRDAISHFRAHIEHYRHKTGHNLLLFQHYAWLSKQFSMFAELLEEMAHQGFPSVQTQHPGFYYKSAAKYSEQRKIIANQLCKNITTYPDPDPLANWDKLEFYGQRPWRPCQLSAEPLDPDLERQGILAIQYNEFHNIDESAIIIGLLGNAISQFKKYKCPRMRRHLVVQMADEYYESKDYGKSLTLLTHMLWDYRVEKWYSIVDRLLVKALATAFLSAAVSEYLTLCLEAVSRSQAQDAVRVVQNLVTVTNGGVPEPEANLPIEEVASAQQKWSCARSESPSVVVDTSLFVPPVQMKATIVHHEYNSLRVKITVRSHLPVPINFSSFKVCLSHPGSQHMTEHAVTTQAQTLVPHEILTFFCDVLPEPSDVGKIVQISSILLAIGNIVGRTVILSFNGLGTDPNSTYPELMFFKQVKGEDLEFMKVKPCLSSVISRRDPLVSLKISHKSPALLHEWYPVKVVLENHETSPISDAFLTFNLAQSTDQQASQATEFSDLNSLLSFPVNVKVDLNGSKLEKCFFVKSENLISRQLDVRLSYVVEGHCCISDTVVSFDVIEAFSHSSKYMAVNYDALEEVFTSDVFRIENKVTSQSPWPMVIHSAQLQLIENVKREGVWCYKSNREGLVKDQNDQDWGYDAEPKCSFARVTLNENEWAVDVTSVRASRPCDTSSLGTLQLTWSRAGAEGTVKATASAIALPEVRVLECLLSMDVDIPGNGVLRQFYPVKYILSNHSCRLLVLQLSVDPSENFLFAGPKECDVHLQPNSSKEFEYNMFPLFCGEMKLPKVQLKSADNSVPHLDLIVSRALPESVFIFPQSRHISEPVEPSIPAGTIQNDIQTV